MIARSLPTRGATWATGAVLRSYQQGEPGAAAGALRLVDEVFERLPHGDEHFLFHVLLVTLTLALPLVS